MRIISLVAAATLSLALAGGRSAWACDDQEAEVDESIEVGADLGGLETRIDEVDALIAERLDQLQQALAMLDDLPGRHGRVSDDGAAADETDETDEVASAADADDADNADDADDVDADDADDADAADADDDFDLPDGLEFDLTIDLET